MVSIHNARPRILPVLVLLEASQYSGQTARIRRPYKLSGGALARFQFRDARHPAATAASSEQNHRSPLVWSIRVAA